MNPWRVARTLEAIASRVEKEMDRYKKARRRVLEVVHLVLAMSGEGFAVPADEYYLVEVTEYGLVAYDTKYDCRFLEEWEVIPVIAKYGADMVPFVSIEVRDLFVKVVRALRRWVVPPSEVARTEDYVIRVDPSEPSMVDLLSHDGEYLGTVNLSHPLDEDLSFIVNHAQLIAALLSIVAKRVVEAVLRDEEVLREIEEEAAPYMAASVL